MSEFNINKNSFDWLRIIAAMSVLFLHFTSNIVQGLPSYLSPYTYFNGVTIFFVISGILIPYSFERTDNAKKFLKKRIVRIYPGLWFAVIVSTIIIFILYGVPAIKDGIAYFVTQFTFLRFYTIDWLRGYGVGCPNGALWTLFVEFQYYIFVCLFYPFMKNKKNSYWLIAVLVSCLLNVLPYSMRNIIPEVAGKFYGQLLLPYMWIFVLVMFIYKERDKIIPALVKYYWVVFGLYVVCLVLQQTTSIKFFGFSGKTITVFSNTITITEIVYILLIIATAFKIKTKRWKVDFSYPIYLFHYIFINIAVHLKFENTIVSLLFVIGGSLVLSAVYVYLVEPRALKFLNKIFKLQN